MAGRKPLGPALVEHLEGSSSAKERLELILATIAGAVMDTRRYAKRQITWFRNQMPGWIWESPGEAFSAIRKAF